MDQQATLAIMNAIARGDSNRVYRVAVVTNLGAFEGVITTRQEFLRCLTKFAWPNSEAVPRKHIFYELNTTVSSEAKAYLNDTYAARRLLRNFILSEVTPSESLSDLEEQQLDHWKSQRVYLARVAATGLPFRETFESVIALDIGEIVNWYPVVTNEKPAWKQQ